MSKASFGALFEQLVVEGHMTGSWLFVIDTGEPPVIDRFLAGKDW